MIIRSITYLGERTRLNHSWERIMPQLHYSIQWLVSRGPREDWIEPLMEVNHTPVTCQWNSIVSIFNIKKVAPLQWSPSYWIELCHWNRKSTFLDQINPFSIIKDKKTYCQQALTTHIKNSFTHLISETEKYVWYANVKWNGFESVFRMRDVSIRSPPGPRATLRRNSKLQSIPHI